MGVQFPLGAIISVFEAYCHSKIAKDNLRAKSAARFGNVLLSDKKLTGNAKQRRIQRRKIEEAGMVCFHRRGKWVTLNSSD